MPIYEFRCKNCHHVFEEFVFSASASLAEIECPSCQTKNSEKLVSAFSSSGGDSWSGYSGGGGSCGSGGFG